jgi:hypothetical protein
VNARGLTGAEIVNDDSKLATVTVTGSTNGKPFTVERSVKRLVNLLSILGIMGSEFLFGHSADYLQLINFD